MKTRNVILFVSLLFAGSTFAQTQELPDFATFSRQGINPIFEGKEVKGYTLFYRSDKADKANDNYHITLFDQDLKKVKTITMQKPRGKFLALGNAYNTDEIGFYFYNLKEKQFEIEAYDMTLKKVASRIVEHKLTNMEQASIQMRINAEKDDGVVMNDIGLYAVPGKGFLTNGLLKNGKGATFEMMDNKLKTKWTYAPDENSDDYESILINEVTDKYLVGAMVKRPGMMSRKMTFYLVVFDVNTGKKIMERPVNTGGSDQLSLNTVMYDEAGDQFVAIGDYYGADDKPGIAKSRGFYIKTFDISGKEITKKQYSWAKDVKSMLPSEANESLEKGAMNFTHKILKGKDGKIYIISEQYSKTADALGIAGNVLGGGYGNSMTKAVVWNLLVYVLKPDFTLSEVKFYAKDKTPVGLPPGGDFLGAGLMGAMVKYIGGFDYQFTQQSNDGSSYDVVYIDYDKEKGESTKRVLGNVIISQDGTMKLDKMDITAKAKGMTSFVYPAKSGYVMMVDYLRKEKSVGMKLVKLNY